MKKLIFSILTIIILANCKSVHSIKSKSNNSTQQTVDVKEMKLDRVIDMLYYNYNKKNVNAKHGFINYKGDVAIDPIFDFASNFYGEYSNICIDSTYGHLNKDGKYQLFPEYDEVRWYYSNIGYGKLDGIFYLIDRAGKRINDKKYKKVNIYSDLISTLEHRDWEYLDKKGNSINLKEFHFKNEPSQNGLLKYFNKNKEGLIDTSGNIIIDATYDKIDGYYVFGLMRVKNDEHYGFIDSIGNLIIPIEYGEFTDVIDRNLIRADKNDKSGYINFKNQEVIPIEYEDIGKFSDGFCNVWNDGKHFFINLQNEFQFEIDMGKCQLEKNPYGLTAFRKNGKYGIMNMKQETIIEPIYEYLTWFRKDRITAKLNGKYGVINIQGEIIIPFKYQSISRFKNDFYRFKI